MAVQNLPPLFHTHQIQAIRHQSGPMLVLAGPGSGKTTVILHRIERLIATGTAPNRILVITFSRAAVEEMKQRYSAMKGTPGVCFATFHSLFFRILRNAFGYGTDRLLSEEEGMKLQQQVFGEMGLSVQDEQEYLSVFRLNYGKWKNSLQAKETFTPEGMEREIFFRWTEGYEKKKELQDKMDFDDILTECYALLEQEKRLRKAWQNRFDAILVDEFQDINAIQYACVKLLLDERNNLFAVGDDDQSIYGFRGSNPSFLLDFFQDFPGAGKVTLDVNYRSAPKIVRFCEEVIEKNQARFPKAMKSSRPAGGSVRIFSAEDIGKEAKRIAQLAQNLHPQTPWEEMAIICRTNLQCASFATALEDAGIPYCLQESLPELGRHWITLDFAAYLMAAYEDWDDGLLRIINKPKRYVTKELTAQAKRMPYSLLRAYFACPLLEKWQETALIRLRDDLKQIKKREPFQALRYIRQVVGYDEYLTEYAAFRKINAANLLDIAQTVTELSQNCQTVQQWKDKLERLKNASSTQRKLRGDQKGVHILTMHSAKGLEFDTVFLPQLIEGKVPHEKSLIQAELEEERRLYYVALSRAKERLILSYVHKNGEKSAESSRFLREMGLGLHG